MRDRKQSSEEVKEEGGRFYLFLLLLSWFRANQEWIYQSVTTRLISALPWQYANLVLGVWGGGTPWTLTTHCTYSTAPSITYLLLPL